MKKIGYMIGVFTIILGSIFAIGGPGKGYENAPHYNQQNASCVDCQNHTYDYYYHHNYSYKYNGTECNGTECNEFKYNYNYKYNGTHNQSNIGKRGNQEKGKGMYNGRGMGKASEHARMGRMKAEHAKKMMEIAKKTYLRFEQAKQNWLRVRQMCARNATNCSHIYLQATKELLLTTINVTIERLQALNDTNVSEYIAKLEEYKKFIENAENITEIREKYPEIRKYIAEANKLFALKGYETLIESYYEYALSLQDQYPEQIQEIISELDKLKENLDQLTPREIVMKLREIRGKLVALLS